MSFTEAAAEKQVNNRPRHDDKDIENIISQRETDEAVNNILLAENNNDPVVDTVNDPVVEPIAGPVIRTSNNNLSNKVQSRSKKTTRVRAWIKKCRARYGMGQQEFWCWNCRHNRRCTKFNDNDPDDPSNDYNEANTQPKPPKKCRARYGKQEEKWCSGCRGKRKCIRVNQYLAEDQGIHEDMTENSNKNESTNSIDVEAEDNNANTDDKSGDSQDPVQSGQDVSETNGTVARVELPQVPDPRVTQFRRDPVELGYRGPTGPVDKSGGCKDPVQPGQNVSETSGVVARVKPDQVPDPGATLFRRDQVEVGYRGPTGPSDKACGGQDKPAHPGQNVSETNATVARVKLDQVPDPCVTLFRRDQVELGYRGPTGPGSGMVNMGNTCYLNSTLQVIFY